MFSKLPLEILLILVGYLDIKDLDQLLDVDRKTRLHVGECEKLADKVALVLIKRVDQDEQKLKLLGVLRMPHKATLKKLIALIRINHQIEYNSIKRLFKRYNTGKWDDTNAYTYFMREKFAIPYKTWAEDERMDTRIERFLQLYGDIWAMLYPSFKVNFKFEAKLYMTNKYTPTRFTWQEITDNVDHDKVCSIWLK